MKIEATLPAHIRHVAENMRERDRVEFMPLTDATTHGELIEILLQRYVWADLVTACADDGTPVAVGGLVQHRPNVATLLMYATDRFPEVAHALTRFIRKDLFPQGRASGVHRIEAVSIAGYDEAHRWIQMLGLKREAEFKGYGRGGETYISFAWVSADLSHP